MKKRLLFAALFSAALVSCTKDQVVEVQQDEIKFRVATENATKASAVYCNNNEMASFKVWAKTSAGATHMNGDLIEYNNDGETWDNKTAVRYWPNVETLDFYASVGADLNWDATKEVPATFNNFEVDEDVAEQIDLLYSVKKTQLKQTTAVTLNFRHALSQIVFQAKNTHPNLYVKIKSVGVNNLYNSATFTFPALSTESNVEIDDQNTPNNTVITAGTQGSWNSYGEKTSDWTVTFDNLMPVAYSTTSATNLTNTTFGITDDENVSGVNPWKDVMILLPQQVVAWNPNTIAKASSSTDSYFTLSCVFYNVVDAGKTGEDLYATSNLTALYGTDAAPATVTIPVPDITWEQGKKYIYTFIFNTDTNGGYDPDGNEVLVPIKLDVDIDDFIPVTEEEVEMEKVPVPAP